MQSSPFSLPGISLVVSSPSPLSCFFFFPFRESKTLLSMMDISQRDAVWVGFFGWSPLVLGQPEIPRLAVYQSWLCEYTSLPTYAAYRRSSSLKSSLRALL